MKLNKFTKIVFHLFALTFSFVIPSVHAQSSNPQYEELSQQIYIAMLRRAGERDGLNWLANSLNSLGAPTNVVALNQAYDTNSQIRAFIDSYGNTAEFQKVNPLDSGSFVMNVYIELFNRIPDSAGYGYWKAMIDNGSITRPRAAIAIMAASQGTSDGNTVNQKAYFAALIERNIETEEEKIAYRSAIWEGYARVMLANVKEGYQAREQVDIMVQHHRNGTLRIF